MFASSAFVVRCSSCSCLSLPNVPNEGHDSKGYGSAAHMHKRNLTNRSCQKKQVSERQSRRPSVPKRARASKPQSRASVSELVLVVVLVSGSAAARSTAQGTRIAGCYRQSLGPPTLLGASLRKSAAWKGRRRRELGAQQSPPARAKECQKGASSKARL